MAYLTLLGSVPEVQVLQLRHDPDATLSPTLLVGVSHLTGYWVRPQPLGTLLGEAIDGGELLSDRLWHPLRAPVFQSPPAVQALLPKLAAAWQEVERAGGEAAEVDGFKTEVEKVVKAYRHAAERAECVVSVLDAPADPERATRVRIPFANGGEGRSMPPAGGGPDVGPRPGGIDPWWQWGAVGGGVGLVLGLCYWRYRRVTTRASTQQT